MSLRVLHVLDHSIPLHSGYTFRTLSLLREQRRLGWETFHVTSPKQGPSPAREETVGERMPLLVRAHEGIVSRPSRRIVSYGSSSQ